MRHFYGKDIDSLFEKPCLPVIVVFNEKHCEDRHVCLDAKQLRLVCLTKLWVRYHAHYYFVELKPSLPPIPKSGLVWDNMPEGITKSGVVDDWEYYQTSLSRYESSVEQIEMIKTALRDQDGTIAFAVLKACSDNEYEGFEVEKTCGTRSLCAVDLLEVKPIWSFDEGGYVGS